MSDILACLARLFSIPSKRVAGTLRVATASPGSWVHYLEAEGV